jgi:hypothetical protein
MKSVPLLIDTFLGLRNQARPERMERNALADGWNVVVTRDGSVQRRPGYAYRQALAGATDGCSMPHEQYAFWLADGILYVDDGSQLRAVAAGLADTELSWAAFGDHLMYAGATDAGWLVDGTQHRPLRLPMPPQPEVAVVGGTLAAGVYQITQIFRHVETGLTTPSPPSLSGPLPDGTALSIAVFPPDGYESDVFVTDGPNGTVEKYLGTTGRGSLVYNGQPLGRRLDDWEVNTYPLPDWLPITGLAVYGQRLHAAFYDADSDTSTVYLSQRGYFHMFRLASDVYTVQGRIHQMAGIPEGVLVASSQNIYLWTEDEQPSGKREVVFKYGSAPGRPIDTDKQGRTVVWTAQGLRRWPDFGPAEQAKFIPSDAPSCASAIIHVDGQNLAVVSVGPSP